MTEILVHEIDHKGFGIGATQSPPLPTVLPGELVEIETEAGRLIRQRIVRPSPDRVKPPCRHFKSCGGCMMQHASDDFVARWKTGIIRNGLAARGLSTEIRPIVTSPPNSRRRATLHGRRTKSGALVGLHARASELMLAIPDCKLLDPALLAVLPMLERIVTLGGSRKGELDLAVTVTDSGLDLAVSGAKQLEPGQIEAVTALAAETFARLTWNGELLSQSHPPLLRFGTATVPLPPGAFLQATREGEASLLQAVREITDGAGRIADIFAGIGTFALPLAARAEVHAVEGDAAMVQALDQGWRSATGLHRVTTETRDLFRRPLLPDELERFDAVVIDPPRAGSEAQVRELAQSGVPVIAAVSCNPVSFARDMQILVQGGYRLDWVQPVDQFRWSPHVELAARLTRP
ncbi:class I SAM-dependent RNA methyltransferase [Frigidibacter sp. ROC022]|uniref:class I SAM-dependent RNA methyltransferase n=1 Tax=Frigidibacter sp. ROC022 TaxID=2971796 RepID=UPI00215A81AB|nr:class I SAM-dependent RNA methyltransferase [Frigidibacter sp. ROC022]MCR8724447.1 class I SAM-dependent RNA methyltransferase [Frigidibacter sp. ROC022]